MILSRKFGAAMIISGTCIGAGMLAIPVTVASCGFFVGSILIICMWALMTFTALKLAEVNLKMDSGSNFIAMTSQTLGPVGAGFIWICYVLLLYSLIAAYTVGGGLLISTMLSKLGFDFSEKITGIVFTLILGASIYISTRVVDHINKLMLMVKFIAFSILVAVLIPHVSVNYLEYQIKNPNFIWAGLPILLTSFGFHHIIPTLRTYVDSDTSSLRQAILLGSFIPLVVYLLWIFVILGSLPVATADGILSRQSGDIISVIISHFSQTSGYISTISFIFGFFALTTSFLGVALGLFDFNLNTYRISENSHKHKIFAFVITLLPAYIYAITYPDGFKIALGYAGIFVAILEVALPMMMLWVINYRKNRVLLSKLSLITIVIIVVAVIIAALQVLSSLGMLPTLKT